MSEYNNVVRIGRANAPTAIATPDEDLSARVHESYDHATGLDGVALEIPDGLGDEWAFWQLSPEQAEVIGRRLLEMALPRERTERAMTDAIERAQALLARNSGRRELAYALREVLAEVSELSMLRDVEAGHVEEIAGLRERVRTLEMRLMASRTCRKQAEDGAEGIAMHALSKSLEIGLLTGERDALRNEVAALKTDLRDMTDRYHEASNEADVLRDRIEHAGAYGRIREMVREHHRAKREEAPQACFERPGGCSCWKAGE